MKKKSSITSRPEPADFHVHCFNINVLSIKNGKAMVLLMLIHCFMLLLLFVGALCFVLVLLCTTWCHF